MSKDNIFKMSTTELFFCVFEEDEKSGRIDSVHCSVMLGFRTQLQLHWIDKDYYVFDAFLKDTTFSFLICAIAR